MSKLNQEVAVGFGKAAWHFRGIDLDNLKASGNYFDGPVPLERAIEMIGWQPVAFDLPTVVDPDTMTPYTMPQRLSRIVAHPSGVVINVVGAGYTENLHNDLRDAVYAAMDAECDVASAVCLNHGDYLGASLIARDGIVLRGDFGTLQPYVSIFSSLTGKLGTGAATGTTRFECDNTGRAIDNGHGEVASFRVRRTRNAASAITAARIREALDIAVTETEDFAAELERLGNITISDGDMAEILDLWRPLPEDGAKQSVLTATENTRGALTGLFLNDRRVAMGQNAAGLFQAHNTWQHWEMVARGQNQGNRIGRQAERTTTGEVDALDREFMALVAQVVPAVATAIPSLATAAA